MNKIRWDRLGELIHYKKIPTKLYDYIKEHRLIEMHDAPWISMENNAAEIFMTTLAKYLARIDNQDMVVGTDKTKYLNKAFTHTWNNAKNFCLTTVFESAMPTPNLDVPLESIIDFRNVRSQELLQLRIKIRDFENNISNCESVEEIKAMLERFREIWELELISLDKMLKDKKITYSLNHMKTLATASIPGIVAAIAAFSGTVPPWIVAATLTGGGAIGVGTNFVSHRSSIKETRRNSGFAYLYDAYKNGLVKANQFSDII